MTNVGTRNVRQSQERGLAIMPLSLCIFMLAAVAGLTVDACAAYVAKAALQNAVDAAVLKAAQVSAERRAPVASRAFQLNFPAGYMGVTNPSHSGVVVSGNRISLSGTAAVPTYFARVVGYNSLTVNAFAEAESTGGEPIVLLMDEDALDNGTSAIITLSGNPVRCGNGDPAKCVNDDIANIGVRTSLFTRGLNITPHTGLILPTGQTGDEGLFALTSPDPQVSQQGTPSFTTQQLIDATGAAANENNLDKITGVRGLTKPQVEALVGRTVCALVWDSDISYSPSDNYSVLKGATMGRTAFTVTATTAQSGSVLPRITINLLSSTEIESTCDVALPGAPTPGGQTKVFLKR